MPIFILVNPILKAKSPTLKSRRRFAKTGLNVNHPLAIELRAINDEINLLGEEFVTELVAFDDLPFTRELFQSYLQGYVRTDESYENLLKRIRPFLAHRRKLYSHLMKPDMRSIFDTWLRALGIDGGGEGGSPFRLFTEMVKPTTVDGNKIDQSSLFRWYQNNKKPASMTVLISCDEKVKAVLTKKVKK